MNTYSFAYNKPDCIAMKYVVVGAGPAGLAIACLLADSGHSVTVFEKSSRAGGSWKSSFEEGYFTENSPRIIAGSANGFFDYLGMRWRDFHAVYGTALQFNAHVAAFLIGALSARDWTKALKSAVFGVRPDITLADWIAINGFSARGARALEILCIALNDVPTKTNALEVFNLVTSQDLKGGRQFLDPNLWWSLAIRRITSRPGCAVVVNARVDGVFGSGDGSFARGVVVDGRKEMADRVILCTQATGLVPILRGTPFERNWPMVTPEWTEATAYYSFGFQMHFASRVEEPWRWCWSCAGPWTVILIPVGTWLEEPSFDPDIKQVWSCCVVDTAAPSEFVGGYSADEITDAGAVLAECLRQIRASAKTRVDPKAITFSPGLRHNGRRWVSQESGFTSGTRSRVPIKGRASNLFALGCFSESDRPVTAHLGSAVDAVLRYIDMYDPRIARFPQPGGAIACTVATILVLLFVVRSRK